MQPTHSVWKGRDFSDRPEGGPTPSDSRQHSIAIMCDDIEATVDELRAKGAQFRGPIEEPRVRSHDETSMKMLRSG